MNFYGIDTLDWREVKIDWDAITEDIIKAGTPMSREGKAANDGSCYGILMDDVQRKRNKAGRVMISGRVDFAAAEAHSGIALSAAAQAAMPDVWDQGGGLTELPEGYPYKEMGEKVIFENQALTFQDIGGYGISQTAAISVDFDKEYIVSFDGKTYRCTAFTMPSLNGGDYPVLGNAGALGDEGTVDTGEPFLIAFSSSKTQVFSFAAGETHELQISEPSEIIHPMAPEFLPAGVGGGALVVEAKGPDADGFHTTSHTGQEVIQALLSGKSVHVVARALDSDDVEFIFVFAGYYNEKPTFTCDYSDGGDLLTFNMIIDPNSKMAKIFNY